MKKIKTITGENLQVAERDLVVQMNWFDAELACKELGDGWRLPTKEELHELYINKTTLGGFKDKHYWSSTIQKNVENSVWTIEFGYGGIGGSDKNRCLYYARPVRTII